MREKRRPEMATSTVVLALTLCLLSGTLVGLQVLAAESAELMNVGYDEVLRATKKSKHPRTYSMPICDTSPGSLTECPAWVQRAPLCADLGASVDSLRREGRQESRGTVHVSFQAASLDDTSLRTLAEFSFTLEEGFGANGVFFDEEGGTLGFDGMPTFPPTVIGERELVVANFRFRNFKKLKKDEGFYISVDIRDACQSLEP